MPVSPIGGGGRLVAYAETAPAAPAATRAALLLHRAGASGREWNRLMALVGRHRRLVALDLPGHGRSPGPPLASIEAMATVAADLIEALALGPTVVVGHSLGGAVATRLALDRPDLVAALVLVATGARLRVASRFAAAPTTAAATATGPAAPRSVFARATAADVVAEELASLYDAPADVVAADLAACRRFDAEAEIGRLEAPVTLLAGAEDPLTPPRLARRFADRAANARVEVLARAGHMIPAERPDAVVAAVLRATRGPARLVAFAVAGRAVEVAVRDDGLAAGLASAVRGFALPAAATPWLSIGVERSPEPLPPRAGTTVESLGRGAYRVAGAAVEGALQLGAPTSAEACVADDLGLAQILSLCLSLALPGEGALLLHADAVAVGGRAVAFLGPSGTGKSTAAERLVEEVGAVRLSMDRTVLETSGASGPAVATMPAVHHPELGPGRPARVPLVALVAPRRAAGESPPRARALGPLDATTTLLRSAIVPGGSGLPGQAVLETAARIVARIPVLEVAWRLDRPLWPCLAAHIAVEGKKKIEQSSIVTRHPEAAHRVVDGTALVVLPRDAKMLTLNAVGTRIWELLDSATPVSALIGEVTREFDVAPDVAESDVKAFVADLAGRGALVVEGP
jgi:pimeloyl-ACP methyl ester carboxylesterase